MRVNYIPRLSLSGMNSHRYQVSNPPPVPCSNPGSRAKNRPKFARGRGVGVRDHGWGLSALPLVCYAHAIAITLAALMELVARLSPSTAAFAV
jgi:hypothetical protein